MERKRQKMSSVEDDKELYKFWGQRRRLFSKFDEGIELDRESWYSVTPENIAIHHAQRFKQFIGDRPAVIVDAFCGAGGNTIQFACSSPHITVIGCDICPKKIELAINNAGIYGVRHQCQFIVGDFMQLVQNFRSSLIDAVFLSPPWGGPRYKDEVRYSLNSMVPNGYKIMQACRQYLTNNIGLLLPRNVDRHELQTELLTLKYPLLEIEENLVKTKVKTITVYFGELIDDTDDEKKDLHR